jgi:hypothetical protein
VNAAVDANRVFEFFALLQANATLDQVGANFFVDSVNVRACSVDYDLSDLF